VLKHSLGCSGVGFTCGDGVIMVLTKKVDYQVRDILVSPSTTE
jgi:hypothetical protein